MSDNVLVKMYLGFTSPVVPFIKVLPLSLVNLK